MGCSWSSPQKEHTRAVMRPPQGPPKNTPTKRDQSKLESIFEVKLQYYVAQLDLDDCKGHIMALLNQNGVRESEMVSYPPKPPQEAEMKVYEEEAYKRSMRQQYIWSTFQNAVEIVARKRMLQHEPWQPCFHNWYPPAARRSIVETYRCYVLRETALSKLPRDLLYQVFRFLL